MKSAILFLLIMPTFMFRHLQLVIINDFPTDNVTFDKNGTIPDNPTDMNNKSIGGPNSDKN